MQLLNQIYGSGMTTLIISKEEMKDITKIAKSLEESSFLIKGVSKSIQHEAMVHTVGFLGMLLGTVGA